MEINLQCLILNQFVILIKDWFLIFIKRLYATTLETSDGITIKISGFINMSQTHQNGFTFMVFVRNSFLLSFPYRWEKCITQCCDNLPITKLRDHVMCLPEDSENFIYDIMGKLRDNTLPLNSLANCKSSRKKLGKNLSSNFSTEGQISAQLSTSAAKKNQFVGVVRSLHVSSTHISSRQDKKVSEVPDTSSIRSSGKLKNQKNHTSMDN
ncbi:hypothetical protein P3X46_000374 [Hevea brasiliensis]|uniref:SANTA domain-containing protein n=1 Tax=Hevea brasiliensis TaxID=3981 RepID=A0ABQ9N9E4_HEVBR|nr:hypothetical protein P3X46_000374 [Hevea brasiliensis]